MENIYAWGGRRGRRGSYGEPPKPQAFTNEHYYALTRTVDLLAYGQLRHMMDDFTADELRKLFIPERHREALTHTYSLMEDRNTSGEIYVDLVNVLGTIPGVFGDANTSPCHATRAVMRVQFNRHSLPDGFVTPEPICGDQRNPLKVLNGQPNPDLQAKFIDMMRLVVQITGEWSAVKWMLNTLQTQLRTPQQVRYVWPAIYTLASTARISIAEQLEEASSRAGLNATAPSFVLPYLKPTYEVVSRSVLLEDKDGSMANQYRNGQCRMTDSNFTLGAGIDISGV